MKWPSEVTLIRHDTSAYNILKDIKKKNQLYQDFVRAFDEDCESILTKQLALRVRDVFALDTSDAGTELADGEGIQAYTTGKSLSVGVVPDIIFASPYTRTLKTLEHIKRGWKALESVKVIEDERLREQEHGICSLYNDGRVFHVLHPDQKRLQEIEGDYWYRYPQGESVPDVRARIRSFVSTLVKDFSEKKILIITHHLTILAFRAHMERLNADQFLELDKKNKPINCGVTVYLGKPEEGKDGHLVLDRYNEKLY